MSAAALPPRLRFSQLLSFIDRPRRRLAVHALLATLAGVAEALTLLLVVSTATAITAGDGSVDVRVAGLDLGTRSIGSAVGIAAVSVTVSFVLRVIIASMAARMVAETLARVRRDTVDAHLHAPWPAKADDRQGFVQELLTTYVAQVAASVDQMLSGVTAGFSLVALVGSAVLVSPAIAIGAGLVMVVTFELLQPLRRMLRRRAGAHAARATDYATAVTDVAAGARELEVYGVADAVSADLGDRADDLAHDHRRVIRLQRWVPEVYRVLVLMLVIVGLAVVQDRDPDDLTSWGTVLLLILRAITYTQALQHTAVRLNEAGPYLRRLLDETARLRAAAPTWGDLTLQRVDDIELRSVSFRYGEVDALDDVSLRFRRGQMVGLVGVSGAGKSTLVDLLLGLQRPSSGEFLVNGRPLLDHTMSSWRHRIAHVAQAPHLFDATLAANVAYHRPVADDDIARVLGRVALDHRAPGLEAGAATELGPGGGRLSGGQRQRVAIARALVTAPDVLVLDEPTSALDPENEQAVLDALADLGSDRLVFVVAHRGSTLRLCDRIVVLEHGRVVDDGAPSDVAARNPFFAALASTR